MYRDRTIFVSIAAFNEPDILKTIQNAILTARYPNRINFGILHHQTQNDFFNLDLVKNVKMIRTDHNKMLGVGLSRSLVNSLYANEDYYLQIDAHTIFDTWWDERIIQSFSDIQNDIGSNKIIITNYLPQWSREEDTIILDKWDRSSTTMPEYKQEVLEYSDIPLMTAEEVDWSSEPFYREHYGFSAHFAFTTGQFCLDIMPDPQILFYGEEPTIALRAWTRGYRMFVVRDHLMWHKVKVDKENTLSSTDRINFISSDNVLDAIFNLHLQRGIQKTKDILTGKIIGYWGATDLDALKQYEISSNMDFNKFYTDLSNKFDTGVFDV